MSDDYEGGEPEQVDEDFEKMLEMTPAQRAEWRRRDHEAEQERIAVTKARLAAEREKYDGRTRDEIMTSARTALGRGKTQQEWHHEIDFFDFESGTEVWNAVVKEREDRIKYEEARGRRLREDPAYLKNLRDWEESMAREARGESSPQRPPSPSSTSRSHGRGRPGQRVAATPSAHQLPADVEHTSGLIAAIDSGLGKYLGPAACLLWFYLLRLASPSERHRHIEGLDQDALGESIGLTRQQVRDAMERLKWAGLVEIVKAGRFGGGWAQGLTAVYAVPAVTTARLDTWRARLEEPTSWDERLA